MSVNIKPFKIEVSADEVNRMKRKLRDTRIPQNPIVPDAGDDYGQWCIATAESLLIVDRTVHGMDTSHVQQVSEL